MLSGLPLELWHLISVSLKMALGQGPSAVGIACSAYIDPSVYWALVRVAKSFALPDAKATFSRVIARSNYTSIILPNGAMHNYQGTSAKHLPARVYSNGTLEWYCDDEIHRENGLPAVMRQDGAMFWYERGVLHRDGLLPAAILPDGEQWWFCRGKRTTSTGLDIYLGLMGEYAVSWLKNGNYHRGDDLPAITHASGGQEWWRDGKRHRDGGLPAIIDRRGACAHYEHGWRNHCRELHSPQ